MGGAAGLRGGAAGRSSRQLRVLPAKCDTLNELAVHDSGLREPSMPEPLTKAERRILDFLIEYLRRNTYQPSIREIGRRFDIKSTKTVAEHLQSLAEKGWIERDPARSRGVRILGVDLNPQTVPVPMFSEEGEELESEEGGVFELDRRLAGPSGAFFLNMPGDSMIGAGIRDGDLLLTEPATLDDLSEGDIIAIRFGGELSVKRFALRGGEVVLEPAHPDFAPTLLRDRGEYTFVGRVVGVFRRLRPVVPLALEDAELTEIATAGEEEQGAATS